MIVTAFLTVFSAITFAALNAFRGAGNQWLRYVIAVAAGAVTYFAGGSILISAMTGAFMFVYFIQPWGRWYTLNRVERDINPQDQYEKTIESISDFGERRRDWLAWLISGSLFTLPLTVLASLWWALLPVVTVLIYEIVWRINKDNPNTIRVGELVKGFAVGILCVLLAGCAVPYREPQPDWGGITREVGRNINR